MLNQYWPQRLRGGHNPHGVGTIPVGTIVYIQDGVRPLSPLSNLEITCREPWIVDAWHPREITAARLVNGVWHSRFLARGGHLATVRSLRDGRRRQVADWILLACIDHGLKRATFTREDYRCLAERRQLTAALRSPSATSSTSRARRCA